MLRKYALLPMLFFALQAAAQSQKTVRDSIDYYSRKISETELQVIDSLHRSEPFHYYLKRRYYWQRLSKDRKYTSMSFFNEIAGADYSAFNRRIAQEGYGRLGGAISRIGLGLSHMTHTGLVFDLNFYVMGIDKSSTNGSQVIQSGFTDYCQLDVGYAVFSSRKFDIYPYAGLSVRSSDFFFSRPPSGGSTYNDIVGVDQGKGSINTTSVSPSYQAGACFEWIVMATMDRKFGAILFLKAGTDGIFGRQTYKIRGIDYDPGINYGNLGAALGFKIMI